MTRISKVLLIVCLLTMASSLAFADDIGFAGNYAAGNWTYSNNGSNASGNITSTTMTIQGGSTGTSYCCSSSTSFSTVAAYSGTISFNWSFTNYDQDPGYDFPFYVVVNGDPQYLNGGPLGVSSGTISFHINAGDTFGFGVYSSDQLYGPGVLTVTNFQSVGDVPEPASLILMGTGLVGAAGSLRKRFIKA